MLGLALVLAAPLLLAAPAVSGAAAPPATPSKAVHPRGDESEEDLSLTLAPRGGSAEDRALWSSMRDELHRLLAERASAQALYYRLKTERETRRLAELARERPGLTARIEVVQRRLHAARGTQYSIMSTRWPIDPRRACRAEMDDLAVAIDAPGRPGDPGGLDSVRTAARACTEKLRYVLTGLRAANAELRAAVTEMEALLQAAPPAATADEAEGREDGAGAERPEREGEERERSGKEPPEGRPAAR